MSEGHDDTNWVPEHFIGGHVALDLANAVFDRVAPIDETELFRSSADVGNWFRASGLANDDKAAVVAGITEDTLLPTVREVREASYAVFQALATGSQPPHDALGLLFQKTADGLRVAAIDMDGPMSALPVSGWNDSEAVAAWLAMQSVEGFYSLPHERLGSCPRCGWLFVDTSKGGKRRWCSMRTCGNREKVSRHHIRSG